MSAASDLIAAVQALVAGVANTASDPADRMRLLVTLATAETPADGSSALAALGRRVALSALARASAECQPRSYEEAAALRSLVCGMLQAEEMVAADAGEDAVASALRGLRGAVDRDLRSRGASLSPLRVLDLPVNQPSLALAQRLYGDVGRAGEVVRMAGDPPNPVFMTGAFKVLAR